MLGLALNTLGVLALWFGGVPYREKEQLLGVVEIERQKTVSIPQPVGAGLVAGGSALLFFASFGGRKRKD
jgi:hypothetical protein